MVVLRDSEGGTVQLGFGTSLLLDEGPGAVKIGEELKRVLNEARETPVPVRRGQDCRGR
jgi:hypothetical protein